MRTRLASGGRKGGAFFSLSFLDLLACTLGALIFIMILLFLQASQLIEPSSDDGPKNLARRHREAQTALHRAKVEGRELAQAAEEAARAAETAERRAAETRREADILSLGASGSQDAAKKELEGLAKAADARLDAVRVDAKVTMTAVTDVRARLDDLARQKSDLTIRAGAGKKVAIPVATGRNAESRKFTDIYHVLCDKSGLRVNHEPGSGSPKASDAAVPLAGIEAPGSAFAKAVDDVARNPGTHTIILWVRPDGQEAFLKAFQMAQKQKINIGDEPADADWTLDFGSRR